MQGEAVEIGWEFYGPVIFFVVLIALGIPVWAAIGAALDISRQAAWERFS